ncbi:Amino_acid transporter family protein [Hexamita inflata]|uniref:Amino acid transporter family protein n=1 Tax=Hexamita inflata TaxID=28002 RepID=A0AA86V6Q0_9EUKA|nr:Amino acid transporter family protein [Hexamita inflata]
MKSNLNQSTIWLTVSFTFLSCCFGSGLLSIPSIAVKMGIVPFVLMNVFATIFCAFCFKQIIEHQDKRKCQEKTLTSLISRYYGKVWLIFVDLSIIFCLLPISYIAVSADYFRNFLIEIFDVTVINNNGWVVGMKFITCLCVMFPLTFIKTIKVLNYVASLSLVFVMVSVIYVIVRFIQWKSTGLLNNIIHPAPSPAIWPASSAMIPDVLTYITMFFSLYSMHASLVCIMHEYATDFQVPVQVVKTQIQRAVFWVALPVAFVVYTGYGLLGVFMFDQTCTGQIGCIKANPNILLTFTGDTAAVVIELLFSIVVFVSFPCMLYPIRKSVLTFTKLNGENFWIYNSVGFGITVLCLLIAVFLDDVSQIQSFSANLMGIILYGVSGVMLWYKINEKVQGDAEEMGLVEDNSVQGEREVHKTEQPKWRTYVFWTSIVLLVMLNLAAIGCQVYTWVR